eukprot:g3290.t1
MDDGKKKKLEDASDEAFYEEFRNLSKAPVLQECRVFKDQNLDVQQARIIITKVLHLLTQGTKFSDREITDVFFGVSQLFQHQNADLRRMVYLFIKEAAAATDPSNAMMVTSCLIKDCNDNNPLYKANAVRVLSKIADKATLAQIERYIRQATVSHHPTVASAGLVSGIYLFDVAPDIVRRWNSEASEAIKSPYTMVQYHAILLMHRMREHDSLAINRLVSSLMNKNISSPLALCLLIRDASRLSHTLAQNAMNGMGGAGVSSVIDPAKIYEFLQSCLHNSNEMVIVEAAKAMCRLPKVTVADLEPAINVLQLLLNSPTSTLRFSSLRILNQVAQQFPVAIFKCSEDLEGLIHDRNRGIATLACSTLLKIASESQIDRLVKQLKGFMNEINDEFKIVIIRGIEGLCDKYPGRYKSLTEFLTHVLRDEGGYDFKHTVVNCLTKFVTGSVFERYASLDQHGGSSAVTGAGSSSPARKELQNLKLAAKDEALMQLCEFIEDCEFTALSVTILQLLAREIPHSSAPASYVRFIYNRVILEPAMVRAAAVSSLFRIAFSISSLRNSILVLLQRCQLDQEDEVRDRAAISVSMLECLLDEDSKMGSTEEFNNDETKQIDSSGYTDQLISCVLNDVPVSISQLHASLKVYAKQQGGKDQSAVTLDALPVVDVSEYDRQVKRLLHGGNASPTKIGSGDQRGLGGDAMTSNPASSLTSSDGSSIGSVGGGISSAGGASTLAMLSRPEFKNLGQHTHSSQRVALTEMESEYIVTCVKHFFANGFVVFQFDVTNTVERQILGNVSLSMEFDGDFAEAFAITETIEAK